MKLSPENALRNWCGDTLYIEGQGELYDPCFLPWNQGAIPDLMKVVIGSGCTDICDDAFEFCAMEEMEIPATVKSIGQACAPEGKSHKRINVHPDNPIFASEDGFLTEKRIEDIIVVPVWKKVTIPSGLIKMSEYVCSICEELTEVEIPFGVEEIGEQAFYGCDKLENER